MWDWKWLSCISFLLFFVYSLKISPDRVIYEWWELFVSKSIRKRAFFNTKFWHWELWQFKSNKVDSIQRSENVKCKLLNLNNMLCLIRAAQKDALLRNLFKNNFHDASFEINGDNSYIDSFGQAFEYYTKNMERECSSPFHRAGIPITWWCHLRRSAPYHGNHIWYVRSSNDTT